MNVTLGEYKVFKTFDAPAQSQDGGKAKSVKIDKGTFVKAYERGQVIDEKSERLVPVIVTVEGYLIPLEYVRKTRDIGTKEVTVLGAKDKEDVIEVAVDKDLQNKAKLATQGKLSEIFKDANKQIVSAIFLGLGAGIVYSWITKKPSFVPMIVGSLGAVVFIKITKKKTDEQTTGQKA